MIDHINLEEFYTRKRDLFGEFSYCPSKKDDMAEEYETILHDAEILKQESAKIKGLGEIDLSQCGYNVVTATRLLVYNNLRSIPVPEEITPMEEEWIYRAFMGGIIMSVPAQLDNAVDYDINSAYPFMMSKQGISFPIKQGEFSHMDDLPEIVSYGIYHVIISPHEDPHVARLFRFNQKNYYTHTDIQLARNLGLNVELIHDGQANSLTYKTGRALGMHMFKTLVDNLYQLKQKKVPFAKAIINTIWGCLCEKNKLTRVAYHDKPEIVVDEEHTILAIHPVAGGHRVQYAKQGGLYKYNYARIGVFLTSYVRRFMSETLLPFKEHIYRIHTDGFIADQSLPLSLGTDLGEWKIEKTGDCQIAHSNKIVWI
jgi:hypothetical protein